MTLATSRPPPPPLSLFPFPPSLSPHLLPTSPLPLLPPPFPLPLLPLPLPPPLLPLSPRLPLTSSANMTGRSGPTYLLPSISRRIGSTNNGTIALGTLTPYEDDGFMHLLRYSNHLLKTSYKNVVTIRGGVLTPCTLLWISSRISMRRRISATAVTCCPSAEKICNATKVKVPKSQSASSTDRMTARRTQVTVYKESAESSWVSIYCTMREASDPLQVDSSTT